MSADEIDEGRRGNDFRSSMDDPSRSHYTVLSSVLGEYSLVTDVDTPDALGQAYFIRRGLARLAELADRAGLPEAVKPEAARIFLEIYKYNKMRHRARYELAILIAALRRLRVPVTPATWEDIAAAVLGIPLDRGRWTEDDERRVVRLINLAKRTLLTMQRNGIYVPPGVNPLEALPDPQLRAHAIRLFRELKDAGVGSEWAARYLALYLASVAANRPMGLRELDDLARRYVLSGIRKEPGPETTHVVRRKAVAALRGLVIQVTLGRADGPVASAVRGGSKEVGPLTTLRLRCSLCGHEWQETVYAPTSGAFRLGAVGAAVGSAVCPRCGARLGRVVELHVSRS